MPIIFGDDLRASVRVCVCAYLDPPSSNHRPLSLPSLRRSVNIAESDSKPRGATISGPPLLRYTLGRDRRFSPLARASKGLQGRHILYVKNRHTKGIFLLTEIKLISGPARSAPDLGRCFGVRTRADN